MLQPLIIGLQAGAQYAILATALVTVFVTTRVVNFAVGMYATVAVYVVIGSASLGLNPYVALVLGVVSAAGLGAVSELAIAAPILRKLPKHGPEVILIGTLLLWGLGEGLVRIVAGPGPRSFPRGLLVRGSIQVAGIAVNWATILTVASVGLVLLLSGLIVFRTRIGIATRAASEDPAALELLGRSPRTYRLTSWAYAGMVASFAGMLIAQVATPVPNLTDSALIKATAGAAVGGINSMGGAILGAFLVGVLEAYGTILIGAWAASVIPLGMIVLTLLVRPTGFLGRPEVARV